MPKVRILSGNQTGSIVEMELPAAQSAIGSGYAEAVAPESEQTEATESKKAPPAKPGGKKGSKAGGATD